MIDLSSRNRSEMVAIQTVPVFVKIVENFTSHSILFQGRQVSRFLFSCELVSENVFQLRAVFFVFLMYKQESPVIFYAQCEMVISFIALHVDWWVD